MRRVLAAAFVSAVAVASCNGILSLQDYEIRGPAPDIGPVDTGALDTGATDAASGDSCFDPAGNGGHGCYRCDASTQEQLMNACTSSPCFAFDDFKRIPGYTGDASPLPDVVVDDVPETSASDSTVTLPLTKCTSFANPVYVYGSTAMLGVLKVLSQQLDNRTIVYQPDASCSGIDAILTRDSQLRKSVAATAYAKGVVSDCALDVDRFADIGISDVEPRKCPGIGSTDSIDQSRGPIQVFMFAAPTASAQRAISTEAAFRVFGYAAAAGIAPWLKDLLIMRRHAASGTQITIASFIGLPVDRWAGVRKQGSGQLATDCAAGSDPNATICITSADQRDFKFKDTLRNLAYKHVGQQCAYLPDSIEGGVDKRNVRDGHYVLWAPVHFFVRKDALGNDAVRDVLNVLTGAKLPADPVKTGYFSDFKTAGLVPVCAMGVTRDDAGLLKPELRDVPCGCSFESAGAGLPAGCKPCSSPTECAKGETCSFGYCELAKP